MTSRARAAAWATGMDDAHVFAYDKAGERVLRYRLAPPEEDPLSLVVQEATFYIGDQGGNVLSELRWDPLAEGSSTGEWTRTADFVYLGRRPLVKRIDAGGDRVQYTTLAADHLDSIRAEIEQASVPILAQLDYWPYGEFVSPQAPSQFHLFTSHQREFLGTGTGVDPLEGLDYMHARYYSYEDGRFLSLDPIGGDVGSSQTWNRYSYVGGNPVKFTDPSGETLILMGSTEDKDLAERIANGGLNGWELRIAADGTAELVETEKNGEKTAEQQALEDALREIIDDSETVSLNLSNRSSDRPFGGMDSTVDVGDINRMGSGPGPTRASTFAHEVYEGFLKQTRGLDYLSAHNRAIGVENSVCGFERMDLGGTRRGNTTRWFSRYSNSRGVVNVTVVVVGARPVQVLRAIQWRP